MVDDPVTEKDIEKHLNDLERLTSWFSSDDEYQAAMLKNQGLLLKFLQGRGPDTVDAPLTGVDVNNLPIGVAGEITGEADSGETTRAAFSIRGTRFVTAVTPNMDVSVGDVVYVVDSDNQVTLARNAESISLFGGLTGYSASNFERVETQEDIEISPGETEEIVNVSVSGTAWLWEVGTNDETYSLYQYKKDGEEVLEDPLKEPLGLYNEPYRFPLPRKFTSSFSVVVTRQDDAPGPSNYYSKVTYMI